MSIIYKIYNRTKNHFRGYGLFRYSIIRKLHKWIVLKFNSNIIMVDGDKMLLDSNDSLNLSINNSYEKFETDYIKTQIKKGDVVIDVGANIGYYTLLFAKLVGQDGVVYAFEPDPTNFKILKHNVKINGRKNVILINKAVSNSTANIKLYLCANNKSDHRIYDSDDNRDTINVKSIKLDDYFIDFKRNINFIKMDIQGSEYKAFQGMLQIIKNNPDIKISCEFWKMGLLKSGIKPKMFLDLIIENKFAIFDLDDDLKKVIPITQEELLRKYSNKRLSFTNIFLTKKTVV